MSKNKKDDITKRNTRKWVYLIIESANDGMDTEPLIKQAAEAIKERLNDYVYKIDARQNPADFSRHGKLGFTNLILLSLNFRARTTQIEIEDFFELIGQSENAATTPGYMDARSKLKPEAFSMLLDETVKLAAGEHPTLTRYEGYRLFAVDGSIITLEDTIALRNEFGVSGGENGVASGRLSTITDVLNSGIIVDTQFTKYSVGERESALRHHEKLDTLGIGDKSIILYDRGYISEQMVSDLNSKHIHYIFRVPKGWNKTVDSLEAGTDTVIEIQVRKRRLTVRIVKFMLDSGEEETLLVDPKLPADIFTFEKVKELYFLRWGIETNYRVVKSGLQLENFTGTSSLFIRQDVYATALLVNITAFAKLESDIIIKERTSQKKNKYAQKTNHSMLIAYMKKYLVLALFALLSGNTEISNLYIDKIIQSASCQTIPIRPGRSYDRTRKHHSRHPNNRKRAI